MKTLTRILSAFAALAGLVFCSLSAQASQPLRLNIDLDRPIILAGSSEHIILKIGLDGLKLAPAASRTPINLALVIDRSGSMSGDKIARAKDAAIEVVRRLSPEDVFSLVVYNNNVETLIPARHVRNKGEMEEVISAIQAQNGTALFGGVSQGASEVRKHLENTRYVHRVILLSDGQANIGPSTPAELARLGVSLAKEGITVTTIGLGLGFNEDLMARLASCSDGNTYFVESSYELPRILNSELGDIMDVVARRVVIEIQFPEWVRPVAFIGREGRINGRRAELSINQIYGGQEKYALIEVEVSPGSAGSKRQVAEANVSYEDVRSQKQQSLRSEVSLHYTKDESVVIKGANQRVQADYAANVIAQAKEKAIELADAGRTAEAASHMKAKSASMLSLAREYGNVMVSAAAAPAMASAEKLEREGLDNTARKSYRADSAQTKNQQGSK